MSNHQSTSCYKILPDGSIEIELTRGYVAIVDAIDSDLLQYKWHAIPDMKYPRADNAVASRTERSDGHRRTVLLHRVILGRMLDRDILPSETVDHADLSLMNNRRSNLRLADRSQQGANQQKPSHNTSGYKGVSLVKNGRWRVQIKTKGKVLHIGLFDDPVEAHNAYCEAAIKYHGEFARFK